MRCFAVDGSSPHGMPWLGGSSGMVGGMGVCVSFKYKSGCVFICSSLSLSCCCVHVSIHANVL